MKALLAFCFSLLSINSAWALREYPFPSLTSQDTNSRVVVERNLPENTVVRHSVFSVTIPKGWTLNPVGPSKKSTASLTATPTSKIETDPTYFGIHIRKTAPPASLDERKAKFAKAGRLGKFVTWQGRRWLLLESSAQNSTGQKVRNWTAFTTSAGKDIWVVAATPQLEVSKFQKVLFKIMESIKLNKE